MQWRLGPTSPAAALTAAALIAYTSCTAPQAARATAPGADPVSRWNAVALEAGRQKTLLVQARALAMVHAAIFDAVNGIDRRYEPYLIAARAPGPASAPAALAAAAHAVLVALHPEQRAVLDASLAADLAPIAAGAARTTGIVYGEQIAKQVVAARSGDGADTTIAHAPRAEVGFWQPTPSANAPALGPHWGAVRPFLLGDPGSFAPPRPPAVASPDYARDFEEVKRVGAKSYAGRTPDQAAAVAFWTGYAPQLWSSAARGALARRADLALVDRARIFALLSGAIADAFVVGWAAKYRYEVWRPVTAIRAAEHDGNDRTAADPAWEPAIATPPFPCYVSGHAITAGAAEQILAIALGMDRVPLVITNPEVGVTRSFRALSDMAQEAREVRIWSGVHFRFSQVEGLAAGRRIGRAIAATRLRPAAP